jgi:hypothetical protein
MYSEKSIIFIDETCISTDLNPLKGYWYNGKTPELVKTNLKSRLSVISAITNDRLLGFMIIKPSVKCCNFGIFLLELL